MFAHELGSDGRDATDAELVAAAKGIGLILDKQSRQTQSSIAALRRPALMRRQDGSYLVVLPALHNGECSVADPTDETVDSRPVRMSLATLTANWPGELFVVQRVDAQFVAPPADFGLKWFVPIVWRYRRPLGHVLIASCFVQLFALTTPLFFQIIVDKVLVHKTLATLYVVVLGLVVLGLFDVSLQYLRTYVLAHTANKLDVELGARIFRHLFRLPQSYFDARPVGQTVARLRELESIRSFLTSQGLMSVIDLLFTVVLLGALFAYSSQLALVVVVWMPLYVIVAAVLRPILRQKLQQKYNTGAESQQFLVESVVGSQTIKTAGIEGLVGRQWSDRLAAYVKSAFEALMVATAGQNTIQYLSKGMTAAVLFFGAKAVIDGGMTVGELVAFNMIASQVTAPILRLANLWQDVQQVQVSVERIGDILESPPEPHPKIWPALKPMRGEIRLVDVHFRYEASAADVLRGITLHVPAGQVIGIVGPSGSGKSTVAKLVERLYLPGRGRLFVDGMDLVHVPLAWLRGQIGTVMQESILFNRSVRENIAFGVPSADLGRIREVARLAGADDFISALPQGYDSPIVERGANLSGGQRQRIALARALIRDPKILIFDEATSALDYETQAIIERNMPEIARGRTVIIIAHRLTAVRRCDRIVSIVDGLVVEDGKHAELLTRNSGFYQRAWGLQSGEASA